MSSNPFDDEAALRRVSRESRAHAFAVVTVLAVTAEKVGTRSATARYEVRIEEQLTGLMPSEPVLKHWGAPALLVQQRTLIGAVDSGRFQGAWELVYARDVTGLSAAQLRLEFEEGVEP